MKEVHQRDAIHVSDELIGREHRIDKTSRSRSQSQGALANLPSWLHVVGANNAMFSARWKSRPASGAKGRVSYASATFEDHEQS